MTDPALDDDKAERAINEALYSGNPKPGDRAAVALLEALNEQGVVLCDEHALAELRQQAKAGEAVSERQAALIAALFAYVHAMHPDDARAIVAEVARATGFTPEDPR